MHQYKIMRILASLWLATSLVPSLALAQEVDTNATVTAEEALEGIVVEEPKKVPSTFGLLWRGVKERASITLTLDPVKKAEKQIKFAEERLKIAEKIAAEGDNPELEAKLEQMVDRANEFINQAAARKEKFLKNPDARVERLLKNLATHEERKERVLDKIEDRLPEEKRAAFEKRREAMKPDQERLLNALQNENTPKAVKEHLQNVKTRIEASAKVKMEFKQEAQPLLERLKAGDTTAKDDLQKLREERKQNLQDIRADFKTQQKTVKPFAPSDTDQKQKSQPEMKQTIRREIKQEIRRDIRKEIKTNRNAEEKVTQ